MVVTQKYHQTISPRSTRDLRAEVMDLAATIACTSDRGTLVIIDRRLSPQTIRSEWNRLLKAFPPELQSRLALELAEPEARSPVRRSAHARTDVVMLDPPNFRYEVMRQLIEADINQAASQSVDDLVQTIGASPFTVRKVLTELVQCGIAKQTNPTNARFFLTTTEINLELLGVVQALPQTLRFRYAAGTRPRSTEELLTRFEQLMQPDAPEGWKNIGLSGSSAARVLRLPQVDLLGAPRIDLAVYAGKAAKTFDPALILRLDSGLEYVRDIRWPAPLVLTVVRSNPTFNRPEDVIPWRYAQGCDMYLALLDAGLREQAVQFAAHGGKKRESRVP